MEINFKIAKYKKEGDSFIKSGYNQYQITFLKGKKIHQLRIVVNGYLTKETINLVEGNSGYKNKILRGVTEGWDELHKKTYKSVEKFLNEIVL